MENFLAGLCLGIVLTLAVTSVVLSAPLYKCAKNNNVYECQYKAIPIKEHKNGSDKITPKKDEE